MKVYELARELGVETFDVAQALEKLDVYVNNDLDEVPLGYQLTVAKLIIAELLRGFELQEMRDEL